MERVSVALIEQLRAAEDPALWTATVVAHTTEPLDGALNVDGLSQLLVDADGLVALAADPRVLYVREPWLAAPKTTSDGVDEILEVDWHAQGVRGAGVTVGVVDVGFDGLDAQLGDELPERVQVWEDGEGGSSPHGVAVAEIVMDMAPDATLRLYPFRTEVEFLAALQATADDGVDVVNASIGFDNVWHADGTSPVSRGVDALVDEGVVYVGAAGNEVGRYAIGALTDTDGDGLVELDGREDVPIDDVFGDVSVSLRWSEPFGQAAVDLDLVLVTDVDTTCGSSSEPQDGDDFPYEKATCGASGPIHARILAPNGLPDGLTGYLYAPWGVGFDARTSASTLTLPADAAGAISVGATQVGSLDSLVSSSQGPTDDGRLKPDLMAPSGVSTSVYSIFDGTSAASPHVAGLAALFVELRKRDTPSEIRDLMTERALDLGDEGPDNETGYGAARAGELPEAQTCGGCSGGAVPGGLWMVALAVLWRRRS